MYLDGRHNPRDGIRPVPKSVVPVPAICTHTNKNRVPSQCNTQDRFTLCRAWYQTFVSEVHTKSASWMRTNNASGSAGTIIPYFIPWLYLAQTSTLVNNITQENVAYSYFSNTHPPHAHNTNNTRDKLVHRVQKIFKFFKFFFEWLFLRTP